MRKIMGIDPGLTTGLCLYSGTGQFIDGREAKSAMEVANYILEHMPDLIVMEDYIVSPRPSRPKEPLKIIGVVEFLCEENVIKLKMQSPSVLSRMIKRISTVPSPHIRSACAHVLYYLVSHDIS